MTTVISELTGEPIDTASEDWRHECELRSILAMPSREDRNRYLFGGTNPATGRQFRGVAQHRGEAAAKELQRQAESLFYLRRDRARQTAKPAQGSLL